ncbi:MAG: helix-turn-helix domain-containing protein [Saprospiraceae bacterium]
MSVQATHSELTILESARKQFGSRGFSGVSLQDIATDAGTTKSMINYYFRSKEKLFARVFTEEFKKLFTSIGQVLASDLTLKKKIERIITIDFELLMSMPELPIFIMSELQRNPDLLFKDLDAVPIKNLVAQLDKDILKEVNNKTIRYIAPMDLMMNVQSLTIYPFVAKPMLIHKFGISEKNFMALMNKRKSELIDFIWNSIKIK